MNQKIKEMVSNRQYYENTKQSIERDIERQIEILITRLDNCKSDLQELAKKVGDEKESGILVYRVVSRLDSLINCLDFQNLTHLAARYAKVKEIVEIVNILDEEE